MPTSVDHKALDRYVRAVLEAVGVPADDAAVVADCLVYANLSGVDSHGVVRLPHYVRRLTNGTIKANPGIVFDQPKAAAMRVDGDDGLGHVVTAQAVKRGIEVCRNVGTVTIAIGNSGHFGMAGYYLREITRAGFVGMVTTNTDAMIVPPGARRAFIGTNPLAYGFPTGGEPFVVDFATTLVAYGKVALARAENQSIPDDWGVDEEGEPTTDPHRIRGMHPVGGHKGAGLAMAIDLFCSMFTGMPFGPHVNRMYLDMDAPRKLGHFITLWDVDTFIPLDEVRRRIDQFIAELHALPTRTEDTRLFFPGEPEALRRAERGEHGIPIERGLLAELRELADQLNVDASALR